MHIIHLDALPQSVFLFINYITRSNSGRIVVIGFIEPIVSLRIVLFVNFGDFYCDSTQEWSHSTERQLKM